MRILFILSFFLVPILGWSSGNVNVSPMSKPKTMKKEVKETKMKDCMNEESKDECMERKAKEDKMKKDEQ